MQNALLDVPGVGTLYWAPSYCSGIGDGDPQWEQHYHRYQPGYPYFRLVLTLTTPFRASGAESFEIRQEVGWLTTQHKAYGLSGQTSETRFPPWFVRFLRELQHELHSEAIACFNNADLSDGRELVIFVTGVRHGRVLDADSLLAAIANHCSRRARSVGQRRRYFVLQAPQLWLQTGHINPAHQAVAFALSRRVEAIVRGGSIAVYAADDQAALEAATLLGWRYCQRATALGWLELGNRGANPIAELTILQSQLQDGVTPVLVTGSSQVKYLTGIYYEPEPLRLHYEGMEVG